MIAERLRKHHDRWEVSPDVVGAHVGEEGVTVAGQRYRNVNVFEFDGHVYVLSHKAVLTLNLTPQCNADCDFCYNGITFFAGGSRLPFPSEEVERTLRFAEAGGVHHVSFSGGEPTLAPQALFRGARRIRGLFDGFVRLHTNASKLFSPMPGEFGTGTILEGLCDHGFTDVSISRAHWDRQVNGEIMRLPERDVATDAEIAEVAASGLNVRLSGFLHRDGVATIADIRRYVAWGRELGVRDFVFRIASGIPDRWSLPSDYTRGNRSVYVPTESVVRELADDGFEVTWSRHDVDYDLYILADGEVTVSVDHSIDVEDPDRKIRRLIQMPNGLCYTSWLEPASTLFPGDRASLVRKARERQPTRGTFPAQRSRQLVVVDDVERPVADVHIHSTVSDGRLPPSEVIERIAEAGLDEAVITDHNGLHSNVDALIEHAASRGVRIPFPGTEVSATYRSACGSYAYRLHLLVFGDGLRDPELLSCIDESNAGQFEHLARCRKAAVEDGIDLPELEDILVAVDPVEGLDSRMTSPTRRPLASAIAAATGLSVEQAKERYLPPLPSERKHADALDAVELIRHASESGCAVVLAHPGWVRDLTAEGAGSFEHLLEVVLELQSQGLDGVEAYHYRNDPEQRAQMCNLARSTDLVVTGGSDYHAKPGHRVGSNGMNAAQMARLKEIVRAKSYAAGR